MSLILDALRRAEEERHSGRAPQLSATAADAPLKPERTRNYWPVAAAAILLVGAATLLAAWLQKPAPISAPSAAIHTPGQAQKAPAPGSARQATAAAADQQAFDARQTTQPQITKQAAGTALKGAPSVDTMDELMEAQPAPKISRAPARPQPVIAPVDLSDLQPAATPPSRTAPAATPEPEPEKLSPLQQANDVLIEGPTVTPLSEMPPGYRADFPAFNVDVHVYNDAHERRFVLLNLRRYREGETTQEGPKIIEIQPNGIVFDFRGERVLFQLQR